VGFAYRGRFSGICQGVWEDELRVGVPAGVYGLRYRHGGIGPSNEARH